MKLTMDLVPSLKTCGVLSPNQLLLLRDHHFLFILRCVGWYMPLIRRVLVWMIGFISTWVTHSLLITSTHRQYNAIIHLHTSEFTVALAIGFSVSTRRFPAVDLNTQSITVSLKHTLQILHIKSSLRRCTPATIPFLHNLHCVIAVSLNHTFPVPLR
jgi:hypothetical protein